MAEDLRKPVHNIFNNKSIRYFLLKIRHLIAVVVAIVVFITIKPVLLIPGLIVSALGECFQLWCFASLDKNKDLAANGPYILMRNPMYIGRFFLILGFVILLGNIWVALAYTLFYYFYMVNRVKREERKLKETFGESYEKYCSEVNRFMPTLRAFDAKSLMFFKWRLFFQNNAHWNFLTVFIIFIALLTQRYLELFR